MAESLQMAEGGPIVNRGHEALSLGQTELVERRLKYRPDIDGLRALAVVPIVLYHADVNAVSGGFVGVDIFFVISGFLITSLIAEEIAQGTFSLVSFYERRARRILPALFVMLAVVIAVGSALLLPIDFRDLAKSAIAASLFVSNVHFWEGTSYFASGSDLKPLLHTWSLAVEEQFYIVFPALMLLIAGTGGQARRWLLPVALGSFALAAWGVLRHPEATFYLAPTRMWELLLGALLALGAVPPLGKGLLREGAGLAGIAMILWSLLRFDVETPFPGPYALLPCLGAALVIHGQGSAVSRLLGSRPLVFVGVISYSLYLWHWPIVVYARYQGYFQGTPAQIAGVLAASSVAAVLSWRFVEMPFKARRLLPDRRWLFGASGLAMVAVVLMVGGTVLLERQDASASAVAFEEGRAEARAAYGEGECFFSSGVPLSSIRPKRCLGLDPTHANYLLMGDSFAAHLWPGLTEALPEAKVAQFTFGGCPPLLASRDRKEPGCRKVAKSVFRAAKTGQFDVIMLAAHWHPDERAELERTLRRLKPLARQIVLFGPMVEYRGSLPEILRDEAHPQRAAVKYRIVPDDEDRQMAAMAKDLGVRYVSIIDLMCTNPQSCRVFDANADPIQWDNGHLTAEGSAELMKGARNEGAIPIL